VALISRRSLAAAALLIVLLAASCCATVRWVTSTADSGPGTFREAVVAATAGDCISFSLVGAPPHTIHLTSPVLVDKALSIQGPGPSSLTLAADGTHRILTVVGPASVTIADLKLQGGRAEDETTPYVGEHGGAILCDGALLTIETCILLNNTCQGGGGAVAAIEGEMVIRDCRFAGNASDFEGGAVWSYASDVTIADSEFAENTASQWGGAISFVEGTMTLVNVELSGSEAYRGGAVHCRTRGSLDALDCRFSDNTAHEGGAVHLFEATGTMVACLLESNTAADGGAISSERESTLELTNCGLYRNGSSGNGGAISNRANLTVVGSHF
jgi:hypothetical protein